MRQDLGDAAPTAGGLGHGAGRSSLGGSASSGEYGGHGSASTSAGLPRPRDRLVWVGCARVCTYTYIRDRWARLECSCTARVYVLYAYYDDEVYGERGNVAGYAWYAWCVLCICTCLRKWTPLAHTRTDWLSWKCSFGRPSMANRCESMTLRTHSTSPLLTRHIFDRHENARFGGASVVGARAIKRERERAREVA